MDTPIIFYESKNKEIKKIKIKKYKNYFFYNFFINSWPSISCTSGITIKKEILNNFFKKTNPFRWKHLAIDIQLAIFYLLNNKIFYLKNNLTFKSVNKNNLDKKYSNFLNKNYWIRRYEQHNFYYSFKKNANSMKDIIKKSVKTNNVNKFYSISGMYNMSFYIDFNKLLEKLIGLSKKHGISIE